MTARPSTWQAFLDLIRPHVTITAFDEFLRDRARAEGLVPDIGKIVRAAHNAWRQDLADKLRAKNDPVIARLQETLDETRWLLVRADTLAQKTVRATMDQWTRGEWSVVERRVRSLRKPLQQAAVDTKYWPQLLKTTPFFQRHGPRGAEIRDRIDQAVVREQSLRTQLDEARARLKTLTDQYLAQASNSRTNPALGRLAKALKRAEGEFPRLNESLERLLHENHYLDTNAPPPGRTSGAPRVSDT